MAASTPTLASSATPPRSGWGARLTRGALAGVTVLAIVAFAAYAAFLASKVDEVDEPVPIAVPSKGATSPLGTGLVAPDFALPGIDGQTVKLSDFAGRPVWINVWASWCAPCRAEMPDVSTVYQELRARESAPAGGLVLLVISLGEDPAVVRRYLDNTKYQLPVLVDPDFALTAGYRITGLPTHYFVGRDGVIKDFAIGGLKPNGMRSRLAKIL